MNAEFVASMIAAKRLEAEAFAQLMPPELRQVAAGAVRICADASIGILTGSNTSQTANQDAPAQKERGLRSISID